MDILYYSNNCKHCQKLLAHLAKNGLIDKYNFLNIDRRTVDPYTQQIQIIVDRGTKVALPPNVVRVPTLVLVSKKHETIVGEDIYAHLEPTVARGQKMAVGENGEPSGYVLAPSSGGVSIVSETYTMYDASPEELLAKGNGTMRQMYNYAPANNELDMIPTPNEESEIVASRGSRSMTMPQQNQMQRNQAMDNRDPGMVSSNRMISGGLLPSNQSASHGDARSRFSDSDDAQQYNASNRNAMKDYSGAAAKYNTYALPDSYQQTDGVYFRAGQVVVPELQRPPAHRHEKIGGDVTIESLQQKRNEELQFAMPPMAQQLNQAVIPDIVDIRPPGGFQGQQSQNQAYQSQAYQSQAYPSQNQAYPSQNQAYPSQNQAYQSQAYQSQAYPSQNKTNYPPQQQNAYFGGSPEPPSSYSYPNAMPKLNPEDAREMLFGKRPDDRGKPQVLSAPYLVNI